MLFEHQFTLDLTHPDRFNDFFHDEKVECITLMPRPPKANQLKEDTLVNGHFNSYCLKHDISFYLQKEDASQTHYHGLMRFPDNKVRKNFVKWYNRAYGKFYKSDKQSADGWYQYVHKDIPDVEYIEQPDPMPEL